MSERERFEAWAKEKTSMLCLKQPNSNDYCSSYAQLAWAAWQAAAITEITPAMVEAASDAYMPFGDMAFAIQAAIAHAGSPENETPA